MFVRQIALVAGDLEPAVEDLCAVLGVEVCFHDPGVGEFGLENALMPIGDTFLEVVSPVQERTTAGRFLDRRGGDGGYMVIFQTQDLAADRLRISNLGVRIVWEANLDDIRAFHMHPRDLGGAIVSIDHPRDATSWRWAGPRWREKVRTERVSRIVGAEIQANDPARMAARWAEVLGLEARSIREAHEIPLAIGAIRFVPSRDGRGEGVSGFDVQTTAPDRIRQAARERGLDVGPGHVQICGTRIGFV